MRSVVFLVFAAGRLKIERIDDIWVKINIKLGMESRDYKIDAVTMLEACKLVFEWKEGLIELCQGLKIEVVGSALLFREQDHTLVTDRTEGDRAFGLIHIIST